MVLLMEREVMLVGPGPAALIRHNQDHDDTDQPEKEAQEKAGVRGTTHPKAIRFIGR
jgi:hypothetical protein